MGVLRPTHENILTVVSYVLNRNTVDARVAYNVSTDWENRSITVVVRNKDTGNEEFVWFEDTYDWPDRFKAGLAKAKKKVLDRY